MPLPEMLLRKLTRDSPRMSYGSQILGIDLAVTTIKYTIHPMTRYPSITAVIRFSLRSLRLCFRFCPSIRSSCLGLKSDRIRGAVFSSSVTVSSAQCTYVDRQRLTFAWSQETIGERKCDQAGDGENEVWEELTLNSS